MVNTLAELDVMGISFVSVTEPFDGTSPEGKLLIHLVSAFSEFERAIVRGTNVQVLDRSLSVVRTVVRPKATWGINGAAISHDGWLALASGSRSGLRARAVEFVSLT
jgi:hypothetical protein